jgi:hypothetical protein
VWPLHHLETFDARMTTEATFHLCRASRGQLDTANKVEGRWQPSFWAKVHQDVRSRVGFGFGISVAFDPQPQHALYPRVVISLLRGRLKKPPFCHSYTSFGVCPRDHYMSLQRSTTRVCNALLQISEQTVPTCSAKISCTNAPSCTMWFKQVTKYDAVPTQPSITHNR